MIKRERPNNNYLNIYNHAKHGDSKPPNKSGLIAVAIIVIIIVGAILLG